ncbi:MAG: ROK family protein [Burkholderiaceae bacterium]
MRFGIDLGGTKIEIIALSDDGSETLRKRVDTPAGDYNAIVQTIVSLVNSAEQELGQQGTVGVGIPGALSLATGLVKNANSTALNGNPLKEDLENGLGREVRLSNDANCFALSEAADGAGAGCATVFGVILGTGCGGGLVVNGQVLTGVNAIGGEWGHNPLPAPRDDERPGPTCYCGRSSCVEAWVSGPSFARSYQRAGAPLLKPPQIMQRVRSGEALATECFERYLDRLARSLAVVMNIFDPEVIVLGGGMSNISEIYEQVPGIWSPYVFSDRIDTRLLPNQHGDSSGVRGAAWLWPVNTEQ